LLAQDSRDQVQQELAGRALGISAQILREREGYYTALERCQRGDLDVTGWLSWFVQQLTAAAASHGAVVVAVRRKAAFWWHHRRSGFNSRQRTQPCLSHPLARTLPSGWEGRILRRGGGLGQKGPTVALVNQACPSACDLLHPAVRARLWGNIASLALPRSPWHHPGLRRACHRPDRPVFLL
jgi:hypothetical protein